MLITDEQHTDPSDGFSRNDRYATLAQMDRAPGYELGGQEFDSLRSHQIFNKGNDMKRSGKR